MDGGEATVDDEGVEGDGDDDGEYDDAATLGTNKTYSGSCIET